MFTIILKLEPMSATPSVDSRFRGNHDEPDVAACENGSLHHYGARVPSVLRRSTESGPRVV